MFEMKNRFDLQTQEIVVNRRLEMVHLRIKKGRPVKEILSKFHISRPVFYKHLNRYNEYGKLGLCNLSKAPLNHGRKISLKKEASLIKLHSEYPFFSSYELNQLIPLNPKTIQRIFKRRGLKKIYKPKSEKKKLLEKLKKELAKKKEILKSFQRKH